MAALKNRIRKGKMKTILNNNKKINKFLYGWKLYIDYGQGWEYETFEDKYKNFKENKRLYRENCHYPQRWSKGREINPAYIQ